MPFVFGGAAQKKRSSLSFHQAVCALFAPRKTRGNKKTADGAACGLLTTKLYGKSEDASRRTPRRNGRIGANPEPGDRSIGENIHGHKN
jgi:hypothetical protein